MAQSLTEQFKAWLRTKPSDERYDWYDPRLCAIGQFAAHQFGYLDPNEPGTPYDSLHDSCGIAACRQPWTFGALLERLS